MEVHAQSFSCLRLFCEARVIRNVNNIPLSDVDIVKHRHYMSLKCDGQTYFAPSIPSSLEVRSCKLSISNTRIRMNLARLFDVQHIWSVTNHLWKHGSATDVYWKLNIVTATSRTWWNKPTWRGNKSCQNALLGKSHRHTKAGRESKAGLCTCHTIIPPAYLLPLHQTYHAICGQQAVYKRRGPQI